MTTPNDPSSQGLKAKRFSPATSNEPSAETKISGPLREKGVIAREGKWWHSQFNLMLLTFGLLGASALVLILLSPEPAIRESSSQGLQSAQTSSDDTPSTSASEPASPFSEAAQAAAREDSQEILAELLEIKKNLQTISVEDWAAQKFDNALALAETGDEEYSKREFSKAIELYTDSLTAMRSIETQIPTRIDLLIQDGKQALQEGKSELARESFNKVLSIERNNIAALEGMQRAETLNEALTLAGQAQSDLDEFIQADDLAFAKRAQGILNQALQLDAKLPRALIMQQQLNALIQDKEYRDAMSQGFASLFTGRYAPAATAFSQALKVKPGDAAASGAYQQSIASNKRSTLSSIGGTAKSFEAQERWVEAISNYKVILSRDPNQTEAKVGQVRSEARLELDQKLETVLSDPLELSKEAKFANATNLLADANKIKSKGPRLTRQVDQLTQALKDMNTEVRVRIESDGSTNVSIRKDGANRITLGRFETRNLKLKPGRYVLSGNRLGFKDELIEIEIQPNQQGVTTFAVVCEELVSYSRVLTSRTYSEA